MNENEPKDVCRGQAVAPVVISQQTAVAVGMTSRQFLEFCARRGLGRRVGKLRLVPLADFIRALEQEADAPAPETPAARSAEDEVDAVLAAVGRRRAS